MSRYWLHIVCYGLESLAHLCLFVLTRGKLLFEKYYKTYEDEVLAMSDEKLLEERDELKQQLGEDNDGTK